MQGSNRLHGSAGFQQIAWYLVVQGLVTVPSSRPVCTVLCLFFSSSFFQSTPAAATRAGVTSSPSRP